MKLLKDDMHVFLEGNETYKSIAKNILKVRNIKNYKKHIRDIYLQKFLLNLDCKEDDVHEEKDDFEIKILKKICLYPPCMNEVVDKNYCFNHR